MKYYLTHDEVTKLALRIPDALKAACGPLMPMVYPIPRGGVPVAYRVKGMIGLTIVNRPEDANVFLDDIIDSGETMRKYCDRYPGVPFIALIDKTNPNLEPRYVDQWIVFPWEGSEEGSITENITRIIQFAGDDPTRQGLLETPRRVAKAWSEWCDGYGKDPKEILKVFEDGAESCDEMVVVKDIPVYSHCEHHLAAIFGTATIAYIPNGRIVGLSKMSRLVDVFAHRLQVQERLTNQIADALFDNLHPLGAAVTIKARHMCMESRGINRQGTVTVTSALRGAFKTDPTVRAEFYSMSNS